MLWRWNVGMGWFGRVEGSFDRHDRKIFSLNFTMVFGEWGWGSENEKGFVYTRA
ncbi:hypothetical protein HanIR_Chr16g0841511 [Helianthus annuus]|nr:hypothetical protein HanIR_Chr16g0841511 [Helianthus annuus]